MSEAMRLFAAYSLMTTAILNRHEQENKLILSKWCKNRNYRLDHLRHLRNVNRKNSKR